MLPRARRHGRAVGVAVGVAAASLCLVALGVWWSGGAQDSLPLPHHTHHTQALHNINTSNFIDSPRRLTLTPSKPLAACKGDVEVVVVVPSSPYNIEARSAVREGWGAYLPPTWALVFYIGGVNSPSLQDRLIAESHAHKDLAQDPTFPDSYSTLTLKTLALLAWTRQECPRAKYILKADDDVYLNIPRLHTLMQCLYTVMSNVYDTSGSCDEAKGYVSHYVDATSHKYESYVLGGYLYKGIKPDRSDSSKWQLSKAAYPNDVLPNYLSGTAYLLSANIATHLLNAARHTPLIRLEDVYLTGLVARELKLRATHIDGFERFRPRFEGPCVYRNLLTAHGFAPGELRLAAQGSVGVGEGACDGVLTRLGLAVNGVVTALFPRLPAASSSLSDSDVEALI